MAQDRKGGGAVTEAFYESFANWLGIEIADSALSPQCIWSCSNYIASDNWGLYALQALPVLMAELAGRGDQDFPHQIVAIPQGILPADLMAVIKITCQG